MNKKVIAAVTAFGLLFAGGGTYKILAGSAGYEAYKEAMKKTHTIENATVDAGITIIDNGKSILSSGTSMKMDRENELAAGTMEFGANNQSVSLKVFLQDGKPIIQAENGSYFRSDVSHPSMKKKKGETFHDPEMLKLAELVIDAVTQPLHSEFEQKGNMITVDLKKDEIPGLLHSIGKQVIKMGFKAHSDIEMTTEEYPFLKENIKFQLPKLEKDITIEKAYLKVKLSNDGIAESQTAIFEINGEEADGTLHKMEIRTDIELKAIGKTKIQKIDLEGKELHEFSLKKVH